MGKGRATMEINVFYCEVNLSVQEFGSNCPTEASKKNTKHGCNWVAQGFSNTQDLGHAQAGHDGIWGSGRWYLVSLSLSMVWRPSGMSVVWAGRLWWCWVGRRFGRGG